jgi:hypothetical protein
MWQDSFKLTGKRLEINKRGPFNMNKIGKYLGALLIMLLSVTPGAAQEQAQGDLAKQSQNPLASLISLPIQNNTNFGIGPDDETQNVTNIQPVWPFAISDNVNLITRTIVPLISQPDFYTGGQGREFGIGDTTFTAFFSPNKPATITWGVGPVLVLPTATDDTLGGDTWSGGASVVGLVMPGNWVAGALLSNVWDFSGDQDVNFFSAQYFINYNMSNGWYLVTAPVITANWEADSGNQWTVPFGGGIGKVFKIGTQSINAQTQAFYNVEAPENAPDWQLRLQLQFLFPK